MTHTVTSGNLQKKNFQCSQIFQYLKNHTVYIISSRDVSNAKKSSQYADIYSQNNLCTKDSLLSLLIGEAIPVTFREELLLFNKYLES